MTGETEIWHGGGLAKRTAAHAGDYMHVPRGRPHLPVNRSDVMAIAVLASNDPDERERVVVVGLPRHLAGLLGLPVVVASNP